MSFLTEIAKIDKKFCPVFPRGINSFTSAVSNLPVILLFLITLPIRTFVCILSSITTVPLYGVVVNLFPPLTLLCSLDEGQTTSCYSNCPYCKNNSECIQIPSQITTFCTKARPYFSILDEIFCLLGYILVSIFIPLSELFNIFLALFNKQLCITANPNYCKAVTTS